MSRCCTLVDNVLATFGRWLQSPLLLLLRLFFGISFILAGLGKLHDIPSFTDSLIALDIPYPQFFAWATALTELLGGSLLTIGLFSRFAALALSIVMIVAYGTAHVDSIHAFTTNPNLFVQQHPFNFLLTALFVLAFGPGIFSFDALLCKKGSKEKV